MSILLVSTCANKLSEREFIDPISRIIEHNHKILHYTKCTSGGISDFDKIICVKTPIDEIHRRLQSRINYSKNKVDLILNTQIDQDLKCSKSDYCIKNTTFKELEKKLLEIHSLYV